MSTITIQFPDQKEISVKACDSITLEQLDVFHAVLQLPVEDRIVFASALIMTDIDLKELTVKRKMQIHDWALKMATDVMKDLIETDYKSALASLKNINPAKEYLKSLRNVEEPTPRYEDDPTINNQILDYCNFWKLTPKELFAPFEEYGNGAYYKKKLIENLFPYRNEGWRWETAKHDLLQKYAANVNRNLASVQGWPGSDKHTYDPDQVSCDCDLNPPQDKHVFVPLDFKSNDSYKSEDIQNSGLSARQMQEAIQRIKQT